VLTNVPAARSVIPAPVGGDGFEVMEALHLAPAVALVVLFFGFQAATPCRPSGNAGGRVCLRPSGIAPAGPALNLLTAVAVVGLGHRSHASLSFLRVRLRTSQESLS